VDKSGTASEELFLVLKNVFTEHEHIKAAMRNFHAVLILAVPVDRSGSASEELFLALL